MSRCNSSDQMKPPTPTPASATPMARPSRRLNQEEMMRLKATWVVPMHNIASAP